MRLRLDALITEVENKERIESNTDHRSGLTLEETIREQCVWGIDCYTRRNLELAMEAMDVPKDHKCASDEWRQQFIEKTVLPAINAQEPSEAHKMESVMLSIIRNGTEAEVEAAKAIFHWIELLGCAHFKIHPKGTGHPRDLTQQLLRPWPAGVVCLQKEGIKPNTFIKQYLGQVSTPNLFILVLVQVS